MPYGGQEGVRMCQSSDLGGLVILLIVWYVKTNIWMFFEQLKRKTNKQINIQNKKNLRNEFGY